MALHTSFTALQLHYITASACREWSSKSKLFSAPVDNSRLYCIKLDTRKMPREIYTSFTELFGASNFLLKV